MRKYKHYAVGIILAIAITANAACPAVYAVVPSKEKTIKQMKIDFLINQTLKGISK